MTVMLTRKWVSIAAAARAGWGKGVWKMTMVPQPQPDRGYVPEPPRRPAAPDIPNTPHVVHLLVTIVLLVVTFGTLGWAWLLVWLMHAIINDSIGRRERRRYAKEFPEYERKFLEWQHNAVQVLGYVPQLPPGY